MEYTTLPFSTTVKQRAQITKLAKSLQVNRSWLMRELFQDAMNKASVGKLKRKADKDAMSVPRGSIH